MGGWFNRNKRLIISINTGLFWLVRLQHLAYESNKYQDLCFDGILNKVFKYRDEDEKQQVLSFN